MSRTQTTHEAAYLSEVHAVISTLEATDYDLNGDLARLVDGVHGPLAECVWDVGRITTAGYDPRGDLLAALARLMIELGGAEAAGMAVLNAGRERKGAA